MSLLKITRPVVIESALAALERNNGTGTLNIDTGVGKSKIVIDYIRRHPEVEKVLITSPRSNLKNNWHLELLKWGIEQDLNDPARNYIIDGRHVMIIMETIQSAYKFGSMNFDLIVGDEAHLLITPEYSRLFLDNPHSKVILLTATTDTLFKPEKREMYSQIAPIIYQYLTGERDGILNKIEIIIVDHELDDDFQTTVGSKNRQWKQGELKSYTYIADMLAEAEAAMADEMQKVLESIEKLRQESALSSQVVTIDFPEYIEQKYQMAEYWRDNDEATSRQKKVANDYLRTINRRKEFLLNLASSRAITRQLLLKEFYENTSNKILVFSERTKQIDQICKYTIHSKHKQDENELRIAQFNKREIRVLGSCYSLTLGLNLIGANIGIFESFMSSYTLAKQRMGRLHRLPNEEIARAYILRIVGTQSEKWLSNMLRGYDITDTLNSKEVLSWQLARS